MPTIEQARTWYPYDPVHGFDHVLRVYSLAEKLAQEEGADLEIVRAAVLFHDVESYQPSAISPQLKEGKQRVVRSEGEYKPGKRKNHHLSAAEFAAQSLRLEGWEEKRIEAVCHCIRAHRFRDQREQPQTIEAQVVFDADKLDAIGATGVARAIAYATRAEMPAYTAPSKQFIQTGKLEPGEPHSAYHEHIYKLLKIKDRLFTPAGRRMAEERHRFMCEYFDRLAEECE
ncbi:MAG: HD domain-containing protein [Anaerolineales bacterium]|nr:HD domain-containing protein [Anaerolineales bacterium]